MPNIALTMIVKDAPDELEKLDDCLASADQYVDGIILIFNDKTATAASTEAKRLAERYGAIYAFEPWVDNFATLRNKAIELSTGYDWILWLDADDTLEFSTDVEPDLHAICEATPAHVDGLLANYNYSFHESGAVTEVLEVVRLYRNNGTFIWKGRIHETLIQTRRAGRGRCADFTIVHHTDGARRDAGLERNIRLLEMELEDEGDIVDPRTLYYLGGTYVDAGQDEKARECLETYIKLSGWDAERAQAHVQLGRIAMRQKRSGDARKHFAQALIENPREIEGYVELGSADVQEGHFNKAIVWLELAVAMKPDPASVTQTPFDNKYRPYRLLAECNMQMGGKHLETALVWAKKAYDLSKDNGSYRQYMLAKRLIAERGEVAAFLKEVQPMAKNVTDKKRKIAERRYKHLSDDTKANPAVLQLMNRIREPKVWPDKSIAIFCGNSVLKGWGPWSLETGIGGSEEAVIRISKHLTDIGYKVVVYSEPGDKDGTYDGVEWRNYWELNIRDKFDVFIAWRSPWFFDAKFEAHKKYLWLHDVMDVEEFTPERLANLDKVMVLGEYHRQLFPNIPDDKIMYTGNGIDPDEFAAVDGTLERDPHRIIYTSSHVRGLEYLYDIWPNVKKAVPDATLDIYYGWDSYDSVNKDNPERMEWKDKMIRRCNELDGVTDHGRIGQDQIVKETFKSGVWAYPCFLFQEVYCIAAVKAQAAGAFPVTTDVAALDENVHWGEKVKTDTFNDALLKEYETKLINILLDTKRQGKERQAMMAWARENRSWRQTAEGWDYEFRQPK